jgi:hypothetical protein
MTAPILPPSTGAEWRVEMETFFSGLQREGLRLLIKIFGRVFHRDDATDATDNAGERGCARPPRQEGSTRGARFRRALLKWEL